MPSTPADEPTTQRKRLQLATETHRIIELGRDTASVFADGSMHQLYCYHILVDTSTDLRPAFTTGPVEIDVGNGYRQFPVDRVIRIEEYPLLIEGRRTPITEWVVAVGEEDLATQALWGGLPEPIDRELTYRCRPSAYIETRS